MDIINDLQQKIEELNISIKALRKTGSQYAESYSNYRIELAKELIRLKDEGMPVTIAYDIARGNSNIAKLKFNEIRDEAIYKANQESINALKLQIRILDSQLQREYNNKYGD